ncbi:oxygen-insensitive NADPH nitroreductase [Paenibacillus oceani]|uniref:Oxygen-insensitive NADPH nitroreductase n=1 Tax=Paenibacillus oceani TaxID=2772510 RepID=A0A927CCM3_9BACL|nr:oxygen-insensitive NADPH nitroreductase [Paenibacillus oceani]MBD2864327.1 oxygen-insensitive NADPH nitroreductase [Paenibacillus oceani]
MNKVIELLQSHRSVRKYKPDKVADELVESIVRSAQMASTSSNVQAYSVIAVTNPETKRAISAIAGNQQHVESCPVLLIWCADLRRSRLACEQHNVQMVSGTMENFVVAAVDVALAAQNAAIAAESLGLGIVYIGGIRNDLRAITPLLHIPELVFPVFGMCLGYPDQEPSLRPRLPLRAVLHRETYEDDEKKSESVEEYDRTTREYYIERTNGKHDTTWSREMADKFKRPVRAYLRDYLEEQGFRFDT